MTKVHIHYPNTKDQPELTEGDIDILRNVEPAVIKALPPLFGVMTASWKYLTGYSEKYFQLVTHTIPQKTIGDFGLKFLMAQSPELFYAKLEELQFTAPDFRK